MNEVVFTATLVGGATVFGGAVGLFFKQPSKKFLDNILSFAAGVMLAASFVGLILPSVENGGEFGVFVTMLGIFLGAACVHFLDLFVPLLSLSCRRDSEESSEIRRVILFVIAIALHNLPEGIAAGVGLGAEEEGGGLLIALAIAMQNIPEGVIVTVAMLGASVKPYKSFLVSSLTGVIEILGTFIGYFAVNIASGILPLILAVAGGTMLYVISEEMIPETHSADGSHAPTYFLLVGICFMLLLSELL